MYAILTMEELLVVVSCATLLVQRVQELGLPPVSAALVTLTSQDLFVCVTLAIPD